MTYAPAYPYRLPTDDELYAAKTDLEDFATSYPGVPVTKGILAEDLNNLRTLIRLLNTVVTSGDSMAFRDMQGVASLVSPAGGALLMALAGRAYISQNGLALEALGRHAQEKHGSYFGITGQGGDETTQWQAALDYFGNDPTFATGAKTGKLVLDPAGTSVISNTLQYRGDVGRTFLCEGAALANLGQTNFRLQWDSGAGGGKDVFQILGGNCSFLRNLSIHGAFIAKYLVHIDNRIAAATFYSSSGVRVQDCALLAHGGAGCATIAIGNDNPDVVNTQTSEVIISGGYSFGRTGAAGAHAPAGHGIKVLTLGNCKNFWVTDHQFAFHQVHAYLGGAGNALITRGSMSIATRACVEGGDNVVLEAFDYEGNTDSGYAGALFNGQGGGDNPSYQVHIRNVEAVAPLQLAGGDFTQDDVMVQSYGKITIEKCTFINQRADTAESRVVGAADYVGNAIHLGSGCNVTSRDNWYRASNLYAPIFDSNGNRLTGGNFYPSVTGHAVISEGDTGGREGVDIHNLRNTRGQPTELARMRTRDFGDGYQQLQLASGAANKVTHVTQVQAGAFYSDGMVWRSFLWTLNANQRVTGARIRIDQAFVVPCTLQLGVLPPGGGGSDVGMISCQQLVSPCDATQLKTYGAKESEKGIALTPSWLGTDGWYPDPDMLNVDGTYTVFAVAVAAVALHLNGSNPGQCTVMLDTESDDP